jgi:hypothetical protein
MRERERKGEKVIAEKKNECINVKKGNIDRFIIIHSSMHSRKTPMRVEKGSV